MRRIGVEANKIKVFTKILKFIHYAFLQRQKSDVRLVFFCLYCGEKTTQQISPQKMEMVKKIMKSRSVNTKVKIFNKPSNEDIAILSKKNANSCFAETTLKFVQK